MHELIRELRLILLNWQLCFEGRKDPEELQIKEICPLVRRIIKEGAELENLTSENWKITGDLYNIIDEMRASFESNIHDKGFEDSKAEFCVRQLRCAREPFWSFFEGYHSMFEDGKGLSSLLVEFSINDSIPKKKPAVESSKIPGTFDELFYDTELIEPCINILKKTKPPLLSNAGKFIGDSKGAIVIWIEVLKKKDYIKHYSDDNVYASLISKKLDFTISKSTFRKPTTRATGKYLAEIKFLLSEISQKGKKGK